MKSWRIDKDSFKRLSSTVEATHQPPPVVSPVSIFVTSTTEDSLVVPTLEGPRYMNSYRLEPKRPFNVEKVYNILKEIVKKECTGLHYEPVACAKLAMNIAGQARNRVKQLNYDRYKYVILAEVGEKKLQGFQTALKFLWDAERDSFASFDFQCHSMFVNITCFGVYHD